MNAPCTLQHMLQETMYRYAHMIPDKHAKHKAWLLDVLHDWLEHLDYGLLG